MEGKWECKENVSEASIRKLRPFPIESRNDGTYCYHTLNIIAIVILKMGREPC
jgi:hypothetical protein